MKVIATSLLLLLLSSFPAFTRPAGEYENPELKVVIGLVVENMRSDYIDRYWNNFGEEGFRKLCKNGVVCSAFSMPTVIQNSASGIATLFTGVYPADHGIIDQQWFDRTKKSEVGCVTDHTAEQHSAGVNGIISPLKLRATTLGDQLKLFTNGRSKVFTIAMNASSAVLAGGFSADAAYWFDVSTGTFVTGSYYRNQIPDWAAAFNRKTNGGSFANRNWAILKNMQDYANGKPDGNPFEKGYGQGLNKFPHSIGNLIKTAGNFSPLKTTPFANAMVTDFGISLMENEGVGNNNVSDLVTLVFSSMDIENGSFGPASVEMEDLYLRLDMDIAKIIAFAEKKFGAGNFLLFLTSDVSASFPPDYLKETLRIPAGQFFPENAAALLNSYLNINYGDLPWIDYFSGQQIYLNHHLLEVNKVEINDIGAKVAAFVSQFEGINHVFTPMQLLSGGIQTAEAVSFRNGFSPDRSGDVIFDLLEGWQPGWKTKKMVYSDQHSLPLIFYGADLKAKRFPGPCQANDLVPTISEILRIPHPDKCTGKIIPLW